MNFLAQAETQSAVGQLQNFIQGLSTPAGLFSVVAFVLLLVLATVIRDVKWYVLGFLLWAVTLSFSTSDDWKTVLMFPLEQIRYQGRGLSFGFLLVLLIPAIKGNRGWRTTLAVSGMWAFFIFEVIFSLRLAAAGLAERSFFGLAIFTLIVVVMTVGVSRWLQDIPDAQKLIRALVVAGFLLVLGTLMQIVKDRTQVVRQNMLYGTTGNPQHMGAAAAMLVAPACYLALQTLQPKFWRLLAASTAGFLVVFVVWAQSRTGAITFLVHMLLLFRLRIGKFFGIALVVGIFVLVASTFLGDEFAAKKLFSTTDTRSGVWKDLWEQFGRSPIIGTVTRDSGNGESSYLSTAAKFGLMGLAPLAVAMTLTAYAVIRLHRVRKYLGPHILLADLCTSALVAIGVASIAEAFLLGTLTLMVFLIYIYLILLTFLIDYGEHLKLQSTYAYAEVDPNQYAPDPYSAEHAY